MDEMFWVNKVVKLYREGYSLKEALENVKKIKKEWELKNDGFKRIVRNATGVRCHYF